jgi:DNA-directed RNA polymerase specialized sigma24 family protein
MEKARLSEILLNWSKWMRQDSHRLGYPSKSSFLSSGGDSSGDSFELMLSDMDLEHCRTMDALIDSLPTQQKKAIYSRYLHEKKAIDYAFQLELALSTLLSLASKRIYA